MKNLIIILSCSFILALTGFGQQLAFPTAEGYGKYTKGGRGGAVYEVTNLNASGAGSFGAAISASGPRTVVFRVAGTIEGNFTIKNDFITIAGQTAPGEGICIKGSITIDASDVIIRYIRIRANPVVETDAIWGRYDKNIIVDHVSASWSSDEVMSIYHNENVTIQWCMISEACAKGSTGHRFGGIWGNLYGTYHHNLIAHNDSRNPRWASGCGYNDSRNNVLYNWGYQSCYGAEKQQPGNATYNFSAVNMIANYYKPGPATQSGVRSRIAEPSTRSGSADAGKWWLAENVVVGNASVTDDNWKGFTSSASYFRLNEAWEAMPINQHTPEVAYDSVLRHAGCSLPARDTIDKRIIEEVRNGTATYGNNGIITVPGDVGGWPVLAGGTPPIDTDKDGMPNEWEKANGLDTANAADRNIVGTDGYTMLENYLNGLTGYTPQSVTGISFDRTHDTILKSHSKYLYPLFTPVYASNTHVTWNSSDTTVATVSSTGLVNAIDTGTAIISAISADGGFVTEITVDVINIQVTGVRVDPSDAVLLVGKFRKLAAIIEPSDAINKNVSWESGNEAVATVTSDGWVQAVSPGSANIKVTTEQGMYTDSCQVTVSDPANLEQQLTATGIHIFPNPYSGIVNIQYSSDIEIYSIEVVNMTGQLVLKLSDNELHSGSLELDLGGFNGNFFLIRIATPDGIFSKKIIRE